MRRVVLAVYGIIFAAELGAGALTPLLPTFKSKFALTDVETGAIISVATLATVLVSIPAGRLSDRFGPRTVAVGAGVLLAGGALVQGFSATFPMLLAGRIVYGVGFGAVWTAGLAAIAAAPAGRRAAALGGTTVVGGLAGLAGPGAAGILAQAFGVAVPFVVVTALAAAAGAALALCPPVPRRTHEHHSVLGLVRASLRQPKVRTAIILMTVSGGASGVVYLLVPLRLAENGYSSGAIGAVLAGASAVWILASAVTARTGERAATVRVAGVGMLLAAGTLLLPVAALSSAALAAFLAVRSLASAPLSAICYPLAEAGAAEAGLGRATVMGLVNMCWGVAAVISPVVGGALAGAVGDRVVFAGFLVVTAGAGLAVLAGGRFLSSADEGASVDLQDLTGYER